ncbi:MULTISPECIES: fasciclin domain-containing protein [unclassified Tolypothrix]|uniref:fasciclin domain-containing protein n=1 Tax=unclassified Tolypothrix TaxID=2649714 RepID=UPI0005EAABEF|nr:MULTISPECIES: fasciclin domain-containing protein [unclassified Tolypothrix]BAY89362.1 beta-Ig-H3/fasciclin [Microchaete diplosiphon NIES-3275]EKF01942.1 fasciclin domain protein [Tolypothrix sp. PCC 7601]MBE9087166.1 S-layer homology domain-containing protein [Tolypothrix sp. LEGE 11397]UYD23644.1 S-layer homology domain-containing protein [Tolypothrix sp. PCC 7712]UYD34129.1 S-layer homology domain-containing protein [Tolypothrix sp. PCC 7601]
MFNWFRASVKSSFLALGIIAATLTPIVISIPASAQNTAPSTGKTTSGTTTSGITAPTTTAQATTSLSDVGSDYWASPFIQALAQRNVIAGFPDGTFKPNQAVTRAQFAAMIQKAFNQNAVRQLPAGGFSDVPANFWAADAIRVAYETGFMSGYPGNVFLPNQQIPRVQAIVAITSGLGLTSNDNASNVLNTYYSDAAAIPSYAVNNVAAATQANIVVNYPEVKQLNPQQSLTRAEAAAILYQALVRQGQAQPIASNLPAASYIVAGSTTSTPQPGGTDIVSLAASSSSFTTLTSLLKTAGLAETLQQAGPYTVFAPTDQAFAALPPGTLQQLQQPENRETLIKLLRYHVLPGQLTSSQLSTGQVKTIEDDPVNVQVDAANNQIAVNGARVIQANVQASNGVIHAINQVLIPPNLTGQQPGGTNGGTTGGGTTGGVTPGRSTLGGPSYIGVAGNIGLTGTNALSVGNFSVISKLGLTRNISVRPSAIFGDNTLVLVPITLDFRPQAEPVTGQQRFPIAPFIGAGVAIDTSGDTDIAPLVTGGIDVPLGSRFTATGSVNAAFFDDTSVGLTLGVGYNF